MDDPLALDNGYPLDRRLLGSKARGLAMPEEDIISQIPALQVSNPSAIIPRDTTTTTSPSSSTCGPNDNTGVCEKPVGSSTFTLPIILGIGIPLVGALIAFILLHRRHVRKQRMEDISDPHKSMDFGLGGAPRNQAARRVRAELANADIGLEEKSGSRSQRQKSLDMEIVSPYLLPPELQNSRESLHSLSRTIHQREDPYRPVSQFVAGDNHSIRSFHTKPRGDGASVYTASSGAPSRLQESATADLLHNAAGMPRSIPASGFVPPPRQNSLPRTLSPTSPEEKQNNLPTGVSPGIGGNTWPVTPEIQIPQPVVQRKPMVNGLPSNPRPPSDHGLLSSSPTDNARESYMGNENAALRKSNNYLGAFIHARDPSAASIAPTPPAKSPVRSVSPPVEPEAPESMRKSPPLLNSLPANPRPQRNQSLPKNEPPLSHEQIHQQETWSDNNSQENKFHQENQNYQEYQDHQLNQIYQEDHTQQRGQSQQTNPAPQLPPLPVPQEAWFDEDASDYGDGFEITPPSPRHETMRGHRYSMDVPPEEFAQAGLGAPGFDPRRISMGFRPLPPTAAVEHDDPEVRANRIRSFYKEYFDDSKPAPQGQYYEDYDQNYLGDGAYYDTTQNNFVMPYAQPVTRRAMTPPPQSQRFMGPPPRAFHGSMGEFGRPMMPPGPRAQSSASGRFMPPGPRPNSSASGRIGRSGPRKPMPAPVILNTLPTPSKLRDDSFALMGSIDFAPPTSYKERQQGRSQSPLGERRPYSPAVPVFKPLASPYEELPSIPSPHLLRKSGTFTSLDFAPPRRIRDNDNMSDAGSIRSNRSNRSGVSAVQQQAIRSGAYRVSRLPGDTIFMKDDIAAALKPSWKVGS